MSVTSTGQFCDRARNVSSAVMRRVTTVEGLETSCTVPDSTRWIPDSRVRYWIPESFLVELGFQTPIVCRIRIPGPRVLDSTRKICWIPDSTSKTFPDSGFRNPNSLTWGDSCIAHGQRNINYDNFPSTHCRRIFCGGERAASVLYFPTVVAIFDFESSGKFESVSLRHNVSAF